ncbi:YojF family protein [Paenibacillus sp. DMB20]|uniref:YojF family protein n=1 Tax=Paenibacillus sp. DMB20 TaxID=1642570 RepID=UPI00062756B8|nr:YojF family protein [Paenibacillus sp. DMB20]KKO52433.1 hypothetical protein XI25_19815 [Paenibacillus sp. DMB20]
MEPINLSEVQQMLNKLENQELYIHLELTTGAYAAHFDSSKHPAANFITNAVIRYTNGKISGTGPYRVGLKTELGWVYAEGLTHYEQSETVRLIMAGHDSQGKLVVALQLSPEPF